MVIWELKRLADLVLKKTKTHLSHRVQKKYTFKSKEKMAQAMIYQFSLFQTLLQIKRENFHRSPEVVA